MFFVLIALKECCQQSKFQPLPSPEAQICQVTLSGGQIYMSRSLCDSAILLPPLPDIVSSVSFLTWTWNQAPSQAPSPQEGLIEAEQTTAGGCRICFVMGLKPHPIELGFLKLSIKERAK